MGAHVIQDQLIAEHCKTKPTWHPPCPKSAPDIADIAQRMRRTVWGMLPRLQNANATEDFEIFASIRSLLSLKSEVG
eukprot:2970641-Rhodomonas_salina.1